ncbi:MAG: sodium:solute symporter family protein [Calditrichia bacterium]
MTITQLYWLAFLGYSALVIGLGISIYLKRKSAETTATFWSADRNLSGWSSGLSISAGMMSVSWSCVYGVQLFYWYGIGAIWLLLLPWLLTMGGFYIFAPMFRKLDAFSQPELLGKRFGPKTRQLLAPPLIAVFIVWAGAEIYAAGLLIAPFLNVSLTTALFLIALVVAVYSYTGGFEAVVSTDKIQFALVALFITIMAGIGLTAANFPDIGSLIDAGALAPKASPDLPQLLSPGIALIAMTFLAYLPGWIVETDIWVRLQAARSDAEARKAIIITASNSMLFVGLMPLLTGLCALMLYPPVDGIVPPSLQDGAVIFSVFMADHAPAWLAILLGTGLVAAAMSTVDTCSNIVALSFSYDLVEPAVKNRSREWLSHFARLSSVGAVAAAFIYALFTDSLWDIFYLSSGILTTTIFIPVIAAFRPSTSARQVQLSVIFGFLGTLIFYFLESRGQLTGISPQWLADTQVGYILYGFLCSLLGFFLGRKSN